MGSDVTRSKRIGGQLRRAGEGRAKGQGKRRMRSDARVWPRSVRRSSVVAPVSQRKQPHICVLLPAAARGCGGARRSSRTAAAEEAGRARAALHRGATALARVVRAAYATCRPPLRAPGVIGSSNAAGDFLRLSDLRLRRTDRRERQEGNAATRQDTGGCLLSHALWYTFSALRAS